MLERRVAGAGVLKYAVVAWVVDKYRRPVYPAIDVECESSGESGCWKGGTAGGCAWGSDYMVGSWTKRTELVQKHWQRSRFHEETECREQRRKRWC